MILELGLKGHPYPWKERCGNSRQREQNGQRQGIHNFNILLATQYFQSIEFGMMGKQKI